MRFILFTLFSFFISSSAIFAQHMPFGDEATLGFRHTAKIEISKAPSQTLPLFDRTHDNYNFKAELDSLFFWNPTKALIVAKNDGIVYERYASNLDNSVTPLGFSMSKSVTAVTVGYALCDGLIKSIDDKASFYLPELENTSWGDSSIRDLLLMASGSFNRADRSGHLNSNMSNIFWPSIYFANMNRDFFDAMKSFDRKASPPGSKFVYNNFDTLALGLLLEKAVGTSFAEYFEKTVWKDVGAEFDGAWLVNNLNQTSTYQGFSARPRDWIRLGLLVFRLLDNQESCISNYLKSLTTHQIKTGNRYMGEYGFQTWIPFEKHIDFAFVGYWGQYLLFNKEHNIVLYHHATSSGAMNKRSKNAMNKIIEIESTGRLK